MRAADAHIGHFGLGADDVIYIPSPLAHQTGFLYGMWIALRLGRRAGASGGVGPRHRARDDERLRRHLRAGGDAVFGRPGLARPPASSGPRRCGPSSPPGAAIPRELAREAREVLGADVGGAWGTTETCLGTAFMPGDPPERAWSTDGRALKGTELRVVDDQGQRAGGR